MKKSIKEIEFSTIQATINAYLDSVIQWRDALRASGLRAGLIGAVAEDLTQTQKSGQGAWLLCSVSDCQEPVISFAQAPVRFT